MINPAIAAAEKNARRLINFSLIHLVGTWIAAVIVFFDVERGKIGGELTSTEITWVTLVQTSLLPFYIAVLVFGTLWVRAMMRTSRSIQPEGFGYRQGWSFWGWVTPIAQWWIPKRLIDHTTSIFDEFVGVSVERKSGRWWALWVLASVTSLIGSTLGFASENLLNISGVVSAAVMTLAFPLWRDVVENSSASHRAAITKLESLA